MKIINIKQKGFTLIELLIVISITIILVVAVSPVYGNLQVSAQLNESTSLIIQNLKIARERSLSGFNNKNHGVYFRINAQGLKDEYVLYQGNNYSSRDSEYDRSYFLDKSLEFSLPGGVVEYEINFSKTTGIPNQASVISVSHGAGGRRDIVINNLGMIEEN